MVLTHCGRRPQARERSRQSIHFAGVRRNRASARDGLDTLWASAASARALKTVKTLCRRQRERERRSRHFAGVGRNRASARDGQDALRASAASAQARERSRQSRRFVGVGRKRASARDSLDALRVSAASTRALETVWTQAHERSRRSRRFAGVGRNRRPLETVSTLWGQGGLDASKASAAEPTGRRQAVYADHQALMRSPTNQPTSSLIMREMVLTLCGRWAQPHVAAEPSGRRQAVYADH
jgi:hypothetical protein